MNFSGIDPNRLKLESKVHDASPPPPRKGIFGSLFRGLGAIASPVGFAAAPFFPPAAIAGFAGAAMYTGGSHAQQRHMQRDFLQNNPQQPTAPYYPGFSPMSGGYTGVSYLSRPAQSSVIPTTRGVDVEAMQVLNLKQDTMTILSQNPEGIRR